MRIAIFGAGVTTPLVVGSLLRHAVDLGIEAVLIHDRDPVRLRAIGPLLELRTARHGRSVRLTADLSEVRGYRPDACIMSIRPGLDRGRSADERRAKEFGQLANETVGAAGMAFACRAVPATIGLLGSVLGDRPDCLVVNFTNPAGIVTQALRSAGFGNTFGVCSSAEKSARQLAAGSPADPRPWRPLVYGLNHCSWIYSARRDGVERLPQVLASDELLRTAQPWFDPDLPRRHGVLLNEYLHYYLQYPRAMEEQRRSPHTRGEFVESLNRDVHAALLAAETPAGAVSAYSRYLSLRKHSYEKLAGDNYQRVAPHEYNDDDGYSGPALGVISGRLLGRPVSLACILPGRVEGVPGPVGVESTVSFTNGVPEPVPVPGVRPELSGLLRQVARYERTVLDAISAEDLDGLADALSQHPLTASSRRNTEFLGATVAAWPDVFKGWRGGPGRRHRCS